MAEIQNDDDRNEEIFGHEVEPGKYRRLKHRNVGAEEDNEKQHQR